MRPSWRFWKTNPPGAIVDIRMTGMDGNEFIRKAAVKNPAMVFLIHTGSPEYRIAEDIRSMSRVHGTIFKKAINSMVDLEKALKQMISDHGKQ